jgi:RNA polymerase sigma-54 factor
VLSDDVIVERLRKADVLVARRTVAKYRDSLRIPSSVERRKIKVAMARARVRRHNSLAVDA